MFVPNRLKNVLEEILGVEQNLRRGWGLHVGKGVGPEKYLRGKVVPRKNFPQP